MSLAPIIRAEACLVERPAPAVLKTSHHDGVAVRPHVIVRLTDAEGRIGLGEASPLPGFTGETAASILLQLRRCFLPLALGLTPTALGSLHDRMSVLPGNSSAKSALDTAFHDLAGHALGVPAVELLGGAMRDRVATTHALGITTPEAAAAEAAAAVARGHVALKLKVGRDADDDVARLRAVRAAVGPGVAVSIDANRGYTLPGFLRLAARLESVGLDHVEQPLAEWDLDGMAAIRRQAGLRVMADESLHSLRDARRLIDAGAADIFAIKLIKTAGLAPARAIAELAAAHGIETSVISPFETQIGAAAGLALALAVAHPAAVHGLRVFEAQPELATTAIRCAGGAVTPSPAPGFGVTAIPELAHADWTAE